MGKVIAVNGKGGTGKTTVAALLIRHLVDVKMGPVLAIDADPNSTLPEALGVRGFETMAAIADSSLKSTDKIPSGMTKERFVSMRVQEALTEEKGFDLLVMGHPEGPGCYCYMNTLLKDVMGKITKNYDFVVIDNAAGMEHISRRTERAIDKLVLVSDCSAAGIRSTRNIYELAKHIGIKIGGACLVINKLEGRIDEMAGEIKDTGLELAGVIPYSKKLADSGIKGKSVFELDDSDIHKDTEKIFERIMGN